MNTQRRDVGLLLNIARRIKQLRMEKGISQETFFIETDIHIARIESGKANITVSTLSDICKYFGITLSDFFSTIDTN